MKATLQRLTIALSASLFTVAIAAAPRLTASFGQGWSFCRGDSALYSAPAFDHSGWEHVNLPHDFQISQPWVPPGADERADMANEVANVKSRLSPRGFKEMGVGWYRKTFRPDPAWRGRRVLLDFGGIMLTGDVWLNGTKIGSTDYGYLGFETDITPLISWEGDNVVAVRADTGDAENSRWYTGGGLYRDISVIVTDPDLHFTRHPLSITTPVVTDSLASVRIETEFTSRHKTYTPVMARLTVSDADGRRVCTDTIPLPFRRGQRTREYLLDSITIPSPRLWDCDNPHLYTLGVALLGPDGSVADSVSERFGIRSIEYSPEFGFKLNGRKTLLKGIANHHTLGALGAAAYPRAIEKRMRLLKEFGFNHIRTSHNPYSEEFMQLCDSLGFLVVDEIYDKWLTRYAGGRRDWMQQWPNDIPEWVKRDRNHPSVVMWSLGNELQTLWSLPYADWGVTPYRLQHTLLQRYDKTRPVTVAMHPRGRHQSTDSLPAPLVMETDIASYNYRYMYFPGDSRRFPHMIFYQSEANTSGMGPNFFGMNLDRVVGLAYWGMIDYLGESGGWPAKGWEQGVFDISLQPKPRAWLIRSMFRPDDPTVRIAVVDASSDSTIWNGVNIATAPLSSHWNRHPGDYLSIYTFTNADEVELLLNGRSLGRRLNNTSDPNTRCRPLWEGIPYSPGTLEARAYRSGSKSPVATHTIRTAAEPRRLLMRPDTITWRADGTDLMHVDIEAVDSKGTVAPFEDGLITYSVDGPATIVGAINGDISSPELTTGPARKLWQGRGAVILRAGLTPGAVTLRATHPRLGTRTLTLHTH